MRRELAAIPLANLVVSEPSKRHQDRDKITRLAWNIKSTGQLNPLIVRRIPGEDRYEIIAGGMRTLALRGAGKTHAECIVIDSATSEADILKIVVSENLQRFDPDVMEFSRQVCRFMEASGLNGSETARELGISLTEVSRCKERAYDWSAELQQLAERELIAPSTGHAIHKIESPEKQQEAMRLAAEGKLTRDAAFLQARESRSGKPPALRMKGPRIQVTTELGSVAVKLRAFSEEAIVELFAMAHKRARKALSCGCRGDTFLAALRDSTRTKKRAAQAEARTPADSEASDEPYAERASADFEPQAAAYLEA
jgi:ParB/RepB/Spo0J family partition protein